MDFSHPEFAGRKGEVWPENSSDWDGHEVCVRSCDLVIDIESVFVLVCQTSVASFAGGKKYGVANKATIHSVSVWWTCDTLEGLRWIKETVAKIKKPSVVNISLGEFPDSKV